MWESFPLVVRVAIYVVAFAIVVPVGLYLFYILLIGPALWIIGHVTPRSDAQRETERRRKMGYE